MGPDLGITAGPRQAVIPRAGQRGRSVHEWPVNGIDLLAGARHSLPAVNTPPARYARARDAAPRRAAEAKTVGSTGLACGWIQESLEPIQDEAEPEFEVRGFVVAGLHRVLNDHLPEVGVLIGGYPLQESLRDFLGLDVGSCRHVELLSTETIDVAVEDRNRASRHFVCESGLPEGTEYPVEVLQPRRSASRT